MLLVGLQLLLDSRTIHMLMLLRVVMHVAICGSCGVSRCREPTLHLGLWIWRGVLYYLVETI